jgi:hypothetical protein
MYYRSIRSPYYKRANGHSLHSMIFQVDLLQYLVPVMLLHLLRRRCLSLLPFILREHRDIPVGHMCTHPFVERLQYQSREAIHAPDVESRDRKPICHTAWVHRSLIRSTYHDNIPYGHSRCISGGLWRLFISQSPTVGGAHHWNVKCDILHPQQL